MTDETRVVLPVRALRAAFSLFAWWVRRVAEEIRAFGGGLEDSTMPPIRVVLLLFLCLNEVQLPLVGRLEMALTTAERGVFPRVERGVFLVENNFADWQYPRLPFLLRDGRLPAWVGNALVLFVLWGSEVLPRVL